MSTVIHQILVKKLNETREVLLTIDFWFNRQMCSYIWITVQIKSCTMLCWLADDRNPQLDIFTNFKITNEFSVLLDKCSSLIDAVWLIKDLMFINCNKDFKHQLLIAIKVFVAVE